MNTRKFLELTHNPFTPPREGFYSGADRQTHLDHIRHLSQWSRRVLLVTGPFGIGKSSLFRELSTGLEGSAKGARLSGAVVTGEQDVIMSLANGFGIALDGELHIDDAIEVLSEHAAEEAERDRACIIMIDDAQLLDFAAVNTLIKLIGSSSMRLVLFAESTLIANVTRAAKSHEVEWFEIRLTGFPAPEVREYLEWRFAQANYRGRLPFTDAQVERIVQRSGGNPNVVDFMANELLLDLETGAFRKPKGFFPRRHVVLAVVLAVLVVALYQLYQQPPLTVAPATATVQTGPAQAEPTPAQSSAQEPALAGQTEDPLPAQPVVADATDERPASDLEVTPADISENQISEESAAETTSVIAELDGESEPPRQPLSETPTGLTAVQPPDERAEDDEQLESRSDVPVETPPAVVQSTAIEPETATSAPVPVIESEPSTPSPAATDRTTSGIKNGRWLLAQNAGYYTMQLVTLSRLESAEGFIQRRDDPEEFAMFRMQRDGRMFYVVTYGVFSTRQAATLKAAELKESEARELRTLQPWIRSLADVQKTVRSTLQ